MAKEPTLDLETGLAGPNADLKRSALEIFIDRTRRGGLQAHEMRSAAIKAYQAATAFEEVSVGVFNGDIDVSPPAEPASRTVAVKQQDLGDNDTWTPRIDDKTGQPVVLDEPVDNYAFCANLPPDHPINQRFGGKLAVNPLTKKTEPVEIGRN